MGLIFKPIALLWIYFRKATNKAWQELQKSLFAKCGKRVVIGSDCTFTHSHIHIGHDVHIGERASFIAAVSHIYIGSYVMFGPNVTIRGGNHRTNVVGEYMIHVKDNLPENDRDVKIENDVWIGCNVTILSGVTIGEGSIVGAGSVVTKDVAPYTIYVGSPAHRTMERWDAATIEQHKRKLREKYGTSLDESRSSTP